MQIYFAENDRLTQIYFIKMSHNKRKIARRQYHDFLLFYSFSLT
jgi:hypothetical protein